MVKVCSARVTTVHSFEAGHEAAEICQNLACVVIAPVEIA
jgi:hypothetical protein